MISPFASFPPALVKFLTRLPGLLLLGLLTLALGEPMTTHSDALISPLAPAGILSLQLTCSLRDARAILAGWDALQLEHAWLSLWWDCAFAPAYGLALAALAQRLAGPSRVGPLLAWMPLLAAALDLLENLGHFLFLANPLAGSAFSILACVFALAKWGLLAAWLAGMVTWAGTRLLGGHRAG